MKYYMLDNNDSFVYNISAYFQRLGQEVVVEHLESADITKIKKDEYSRIIISPGPGTVTVDNLFSIESYETVHHLVAEVKGI
jgi:anthranilate/para-aminobenzoate synthase component II